MPLSFVFVTVRSVSFWTIWCHSYFLEDHSYKQATASSDFKGCAGCSRYVISILTNVLLFVFYFAKVDVSVPLSRIRKLRIREAK